MKRKRHRSYIKTVFFIFCGELLMLSGILVYVKFLPPVETKEEVIVDSADLTVNGRKLSAKKEVDNSTLLKAKGKNLTIWKGEIPKASDFIENTGSASKVSASFEQQPDFTKEGTQSINLILSDNAGHQSKLSATVTVKVDKEPPVIHGAMNQVITIGDTVSYRKGVSVTDNKDKQLSFVVDNSGVNLKKAGTYTVIYTAKDFSGNEAKETISVEVKEPKITEEKLYEQCDVVLSKILKKEMTKKEKAYEIYKWIRTNIGYSGTSDKSDWINEAYNGLTKYCGDCFTYYAVAQAMLTRAEIDNQRVTRVGGKTKHFWNLIDCGTGWYHFDSCPNKDKKESFMLTDQEAEELTKVRGNNYYTFDKSLYPATPEE